MSEEKRYVYLVRQVSPEPDRHDVQDGFYDMPHAAFTGLDKAVEAVKRWGLQEIADMRDADDEPGLFDEDTGELESLLPKAVEFFVNLSLAEQAGRPRYELDDVFHHTMDGAFVEWLISRVTLDPTD